MQNVVFYITIVLIAGFIILSKILSPIWLLFLVLVILWSYRKNGNIRPLFILTILLLILYFIFHYFSILVPFIIGMGIAYLLAPLVGFLENKKVPRVIAILIFLLPIIAIFPLLVFLILAGLINEIQGLTEKIPYAVQQIQIFSGNVINRFIELGIEIDPNIIANTISKYLTNIISGLFATIGQIGKGIGSLIIIIYNLVFIPLSAYLFLADREQISDWFGNLFPSDNRKKLEGFIDKLSFSLARFFRGTLLLSLLVGIIVGFALWILGIKYYVLLGLIAAICNFIPNVGYVISFIPAILIGILSPDPLVNIIKIVAVYVGEQLLENFYLGPVIIGKSSNLHPVVVMVALILGGAVFGFWGVVLIIPAIIFIREFLNFFLNLNL
jgi:predicted PurR-regulated permease PerM